MTKHKIIVISLIAYLFLLLCGAYLWANGLNFGPVQAVNNKVDEYNTKMKQKAIDNGQLTASGSLVTPTTFIPETGPYVSASGHIFVKESNAIKKFDSLGHLLLSYYVNSTNFISFGADSNDNVFIFSYDCNSINKYSTAGQLITTFGGFGSTPGKFNNAGYQGQIAVDSSNNVYATDLGGHRIQCFDNNGNYVNSWTDSLITGWHAMCLDENNNIFITYSGLTDKYLANGVFVSSYTFSGGPSTVVGSSIHSNKLYLVDQSNNQVDVFSVNTGTMTLLGKIGTAGVNNGQFHFDSNGGDFAGVYCTGSYLLVCDQGNHRVQKFDMSNNFVSWLGSLDGINYGFYTSGTPYNH